MVMLVIAVEDIDHNLPQFHFIAGIIIIDRAFYMAFVFNALVTALVTYDSIDLSQRLCERKLFILQVHTTGFDATHVENIVDYVEQMLG